MRRLLLSLGLFASIVAASAQPVRLQPWTTNAADVVTNIVKSLATNVVSQNAGSGGTPTFNNNQFESALGVTNIKSGANLTNIGSWGRITIKNDESGSGINFAGNYLLTNAFNTGGELHLIDSGNGTEATYINGTWTASFVGDGSGLTSLNASQLTSGTVAPARLGSGTSITTKFLRGDSTYQTIAVGGDALTSNPLSQFAATTSAQLRGVLSDESGTGVALFDGGYAPSLSVSNLTVGTNATTPSADAFAVYQSSGALAFEVNKITGNVTAAGAGTFGGTGPSIYNGGITNHGVLDQFGRQTNYDVVIGTAQTNSGNIQASTMNTTGNAVVGGTLTVGGSGSIQAANSNFFNLAVVKALAYPTNISTMSPDFTKGIATIKTNAAFKILQPVGIDAAKLTYQYAIQIFTNSTAAAVAITPSDNCHAVGVQFVTNVTQVLTEYDSSLNITNQYFVTIF